MPVGNFWICLCQMNSLDCFRDLLLLKYKSVCNLDRCHWHWIAQCWTEDKLYNGRLTGRYVALTSISRRPPRSQDVAPQPDCMQASNRLRMIRTCRSSGFLLAARGRREKKRNASRSERLQWTNRHDVISSTSDARLALLLGGRSGCLFDALRVRSTHQPRAAIVARAVPSERRWRRLRRSGTFYLPRSISHSSIYCPSHVAPPRGPGSQIQRDPS